MWATTHAPRLTGTSVWERHTVNTSVPTSLKISYGSQSHTHIINNYGSGADWAEYTTYFNKESGSKPIVIKTLDDTLGGNNWAERRLFIDYVHIRDNRSCGYVWTDTNGVELPDVDNG